MHARVDIMLMFAYGQQIISALTHTVLFLLLLCYAMQCNMHFAMTWYILTKASKQKKRKYHRTIFAFSHETDIKSSQHPMSGFCWWEKEEEEEQKYVLFSNFCRFIYHIWCDCIWTRVCVYVCIAKRRTASLYLRGKDGNFHIIF